MIADTSFIPTPAIEAISLVETNSPTLLCINDRIFCRCDLRPILNYYKWDEKDKKYKVEPKDKKVERISKINVNVLRWGICLV